MRLPFFRSSKAEPAKTAVASPPATPRAQLAETQLISPKDEGIVYPTPPVNRGTSISVAAAPATNGSSIPIPVSCIFQQLPTQLLASNAREQIDHTTIRIPADWILPQLSTGKVTFTLSKLLPLLPQNILRSPQPVTNSQHPIILPLEEVVTALPADLLACQDQTTLDIDTPEFNKLPKLFDDDAELPQTTPKEELATIVASSATSVSETPAEIPVPSVPMAPPPPAFFAAPSPASTPTTEVPLETNTTTPPADDESKVMVSLRSLVAVMPDHYFICPRAELWRQIDLDTRVPLPRDVVLAQLQTARIRIPLTIAVEAMPPSILASPMPTIGNESVPLALQEIVSQLPPGLFKTEATSSDTQTLDFSQSDIPIPFKEKSFAPGATESEQEPSTEITTSEPSHTEPEVESKVLEVATEVFADEGVSIFAEKATTAEPAAAPEFEPTPEQVPAFVPETPALPIEAKTEVPPVAEFNPEESVIEIKPSEPAEEIIAAAVTPVEAKTDVQPIAEIKPSEPAGEITTAEVSPVETPEASWTEQPIAPIESVVTPVAGPVSDLLEDDDLLPTEQPATSPAPTAPIPQINLNECTADDLAKIEGVSPALAQRILEFRNSQGGFKSPRDLCHVPGISRKTLRILTGPPPRALNRLLGLEHNEELTLQEIVRLTSQLKGVSGCILAMSDGVFLTGQLPPHLDQETISVFAPQLFKKVGRYTQELRVGQITRLSVFTDQQPLSIFHAGDVFLVVIHDPTHFSKALLRRCERISQEIASLCRQRAVV